MPVFSIEMKQKTKLHNAESGSEHKPSCNCRQCYSLRLGRWLDGLGQLTESGEWDLFVTMSYRVQSEGAFGQRATAGFGHALFEEFVNDFSTQSGQRVEYVLADQRGELHGRFHQHALIAAIGLDGYPRRGIEDWFRRRAGWSRALRYRHGAAHYLARYIGRNLETAEWAIKVGDEIKQEKQSVGRIVLAKSAELPSVLFHQNFRGRKR